MIDAFAFCPCGSRRPQARCCGPYLQGTAAAPTAEALMRSRYTAFARRDAAYLLETWDPSGRPRDLNFSGDSTEWSGLDILAIRLGGPEDEQGEVEFRARFRQNGQAGVLHEISRFRRAGGRWLYVGGEILLDGRGSGPARNGPCPCGSGKKYKRCCG